MERKRVSILMPVNIYRGAKMCADSVGQSVTQFIIQAVAQRCRTWTDPVTGEKVLQREHARGALGPGSGEDLTNIQCYHVACSSPASKCKSPEKHRAWGDWFNELTNTKVVDNA